MVTHQPPDIRRSLFPPPKRRRISRSPSPPQLAASSTVATAINGTPRRTPNHSPSGSPHRRASYLSPTKASLARFNPSLLPKSPFKDAPGLKPTRESAGAKTRSGDGRISSPPRRETRSRGSLPDSFFLRRQNSSMKPNEERGGDAAQIVPKLGISDSRGKKALAYVLGKSDGAPEEVSPQQKQNLACLMTDQSDRDSQSATPGSRLQNVVNAVINDLEQTRTPEMPRQFAAIPFGDDDDDPLPETPSGVRYEPPKGILSSEAGRVGRKKPGKEKMVEDDAFRINQERPQVQQGRTRCSEPTVVQLTVTAGAQANDMDTQAAAEVRDKKRKLDALQEELNKTKEDIEMWAKYSNDDDSSGSDKELIDLIVGPAAETSKSAAQPLSALLATFLPFSNSIQTDDAEDGSNDDPIPSHVPIVETDLLPLLQRFTPFKITSTIHTPTEGNERSGSEGRVGREGRSVSQDGEQVAGAAIDQKHTITLQSPSNHLTCALNLTITNPTTPNSTPYISDLQLTRISPWARREIGPWLHARIADHDIAAIGYGLGRYYDIAIRRASCWAKCHAAFPTLVADGKENKVPQLLEMRAINASRRQIGYYLDRDSIVLRDQNAMLRVRWEIGFDWTGEVESRLGARARFPKVWHEVDERRGLEKVPMVFDRLVKERGVFNAVEIMSGVVFGNDG